MKAHIVGSGFGGLAAAAYLIRHAGASGEDITIYEADEQLGGGFFLGGSAASGYNLPGSVFDKEFRCAFDLLAAIPTVADPKKSVKDQFFTFNNDHPFNDKTHIIDRDLRIVHGPHFGLSLWDGLALARASLTPEAMLDGGRIDEFFSPQFFKTEFWLLWSTIMGSLPQHSVIEFRRYMNRFIYLFPDLSTMAGVLRSPFNQHEAFIKPLVAWLRPRGVNFLTGAFVRDIGFSPLPGRMTVNELDTERAGRRDLGRGRAGGYRARDHRIAGRRSFSGIDGRGAEAAGYRAVLGVVAASGRGAHRPRQSGRVLRRAAHIRLASG